MRLPKIDPKQVAQLVVMGFREWAKNLDPVEAAKFIIMGYMRLNEEQAAKVNRLIVLLFGKEGLRHFNQMIMKIYQVEGEKNVQSNEGSR